MKRDTGLELFFELYGTEYTEDNGYWYRIEPWIIHSTPERPYGIRYNLILYDEYNKRILEFDNAHAVKHKEKNNEFVSAEQLLQDFFNRQNQI